MRSAGVDDEQNFKGGRSDRGEPGSLTNCRLGSRGSIRADEDMREDVSIDHDAIVLTCPSFTRRVAEGMDALATR